MAYIKIDNITKKYGEKNILNNFELKIDEREFVSILGPSGCGKTTIINLIAGFEEPNFGEITVDNKKTKNESGVIFQEFSIFPWRNVLENILLGFENNKIISEEDKIRKANEIIKLVELEGQENKYPKELSGGMKQKVAIARTMANNPKIILMDEPFASLDAQMREKLQDLILNIWKKHSKTILFVTHDIEEALYLGSRVILLNKKGDIVLDKKILKYNERSDQGLIKFKKDIRNIINNF